MAAAARKLENLRAHLADVPHPLPCYRVGGKILIRRSEFDGWMATFRQRGRVDVDRLVEESRARGDGTGAPSRP